MKYYIEITLLSNAEIPLHFLWEKVYQQLHLALVEIQDETKKVSVGVSFPEFDLSNHQLGSKLRLFALSKECLDRVDINRWFSRLYDYVHVSRIRDIPENKIQGYASFKRIQPKSNNLRLARRKAKRDNISLKQATDYFEKYKESYSSAPFIRMKSLSSENRYRLMIHRMKTEYNDASNGFSTFGLSCKSTLPLF